MSLINEALKKAQRSRAVGADGSLPPVPGGGYVAKRGPARSANTMLVIGSGAVVLVVLSVVGTVYLLNRGETKPVTPVAPAKPAPTAAVAAVDGSPPTVQASLPPAPAPDSIHVTLPSSPSAPTTPPAAAVAPANAAAPAASVATRPAAAAPAPTALPLPVATAAPITPAPRPPAAPSIQLPSVTPVRATPEPAAKPDERIAAFIEAMRITGVRSSGADARVLIGGRLFKVNDIIDRTLGVRLVKVAPGVLTFADANGVTYAKNH